MAVRVTIPPFSPEEALRSIIRDDPQREAIVAALLRAAGLQTLPSPELAEALETAVREIRIRRSNRPRFDKRKEVEDQIEELDKAVMALATALERTDGQILNALDEKMVFDRIWKQVQSDAPVGIDSIYCSLWLLGDAVRDAKIKHEFDRLTWHKSSGKDPNWDARAIALSLSLFLRRVHGAAPKVARSSRYSTALSDLLRIMGLLREREGDDGEIEEVPVDTESLGEWVGKLAHKP